MKPSNLIITVLVLLLVFLAYQVFDLKQELKFASQSQPPVVPSSFRIYGESTGSSNQDGYWLYNDDEKNIYFFRYDHETNEIKKITRSIYE